MLDPLWVGCQVLLLNTSSHCASLCPMGQHHLPGFPTRAATPAASWSHLLNSSLALQKSSISCSMASAVSRRLRFSPQVQTHFCWSNLVQFSRNSPLLRSAAVLPQSRIDLTRRAELRLSRFSKLEVFRTVLARSACAHHFCLIKCTLKLPCTSGPMDSRLLRTDRSRCNPERLVPIKESTPVSVVWRDIQ